MGRGQMNDMSGVEGSLLLYRGLPFTYASASCTPMYLRSKKMQRPPHRPPGRGSGAYAYVCIYDAYRVEKGEMHVRIRV